MKLTLLFLVLVTLSLMTNGQVIVNQPTDITVCEGQPAVFSVNAPGVTSFVWYVNGVPGLFGYGNTYNANSSLSNNGDQIYVVAQYSGGSETSNTVTLTVTPYNFPYTLTASSTSPFCSDYDTALFLYTDSVPGANYSWTGPYGYSSNQQNPIIYDPNAGVGVHDTSTYVCTATLNGCSKICSTEVIVSPFIGSPVITSIGTSCTGDTITLNATAPLANVYTWSTGDTTQNIAVNSSGTYTVSVSSIPGCAENYTASTTITFNSPPPPPTISNNGSTFTSSASSGNQWYLNGNAISGATSQNYNATQNGNYTVCVTSNGCSSCSAPFSFSVGVEEFSIQSFSVFPNPCIGKFQISSSEPKIQSIKIYNILGEEIYKSAIYNQQQAIDISKKPAGIYFVQVESENKIYNQKLILQ